MPVHPFWRVEPSFAVSKCSHVDNRSLEFAGRSMRTVICGAMACGRHALGVQAVSEHLDVLKPAVAELARLETLAQGFFFSRKWKADPMQH